MTRMDRRMRMTGLTTAVTTTAMISMEIVVTWETKRDVDLDPS